MEKHTKLTLQISLFEDSKEKIHNLNEFTSIAIAIANAPSEIEIRFSKIRASLQNRNNLNEIKNAFIPLNRTQCQVMEDIIEMNIKFSNETEP